MNIIKMIIATRSWIILISIFLSSIKLTAQLSGTVTVPGTYSTLASVLSAINSQGVSGGLTVNISAGYTELAPTGGFVSLRSTTC